jgi:hypothetical protein
MGRTIPGVSCLQVLAKMTAFLVGIATPLYGLVASTEANVSEELDRMRADDEGD